MTNPHQPPTRYEDTGKIVNVGHVILDVVERLMASENTEIRAKYERSFADTGILIELQKIVEEIHNG